MKLCNHPRWRLQWHWKLTMVLCKCANNSLDVTHLSFILCLSLFFSFFHTLFIFEHTIRKVKILSKNSIFTKPQHFHEFFTQFFSWQFFSWNQSCQQLKSSKPHHFHEFFTQKVDNFLGKSKVEFLDKKWRFRIVWFFLACNFLIFLRFSDFIQFYFSYFYFLEWLQCI